MPSPAQNLLNSLRNRVRRALAQEAPEESQFCIFHCRKTRCDQDHWLHCPSRRQHSQHDA